jgi:hypothetical protein
MFACWAKGWQRQRRGSNWCLQLAHAVRITGIRHEQPCHARLTVEELQSNHAGSGI